MTDEFKFTENSARSVVSLQLDNVKTRQRIEEARAAGANSLEVTRAGMGSEQDIRDLATSVSLVNLFNALGELYGLQDPCDREDGDPIENLAFLGYIACLQHFVDSEPAQRFTAFFAAVETNGDALKFFLEENELEDDVIRYHEDYEHDFFEEWKKDSLGPQFALKRADYDAQVERARKSNEETREKLKREGEL